MQRPAAMGRHRFVQRVRIQRLRRIQRIQHIQHN